MNKLHWELVTQEGLNIEKKGDFFVCRRSMEYQFYLAEKIL